MNKRIIVKKGTKSQILSYFYSILASLSSNPSDRKAMQKESEIAKRMDQEEKVYVGTIRVL